LCWIVNNLPPSGWGNPAKIVVCFFFFFKKKKNEFSKTIPTLVWNHNKPYEHDDRNEHTHHHPTPPHRAAPARIFSSSSSLSLSLFFWGGKFEEKRVLG
jgi:hypothetical protein